MAGATKSVNETKVSHNRMLVHRRDVETRIFLNGLVPVVLFGRGAIAFRPSLWSNRLDRQYSSLELSAAVSLLQVTSPPVRFRLGLRPSAAALRA